MARAAVAGVLLLGEGEEWGECCEGVLWLGLFLGSGGAGLWLSGRGLLGAGIGIGLLRVEGAEELEEGVIWVGHGCLCVC